MLRFCPVLTARGFFVPKYDVAKRNRFAAEAEKAASDERAAQTISLRERREIIRRGRFMER